MHTTPVPQLRPILQRSLPHPRHYIITQSGRHRVSRLSLWHMVGTTFAFRNSPLLTPVLATLFSINGPTRQMAPLPPTLTKLLIPPSSYLQSLLVVLTVCFGPPRLGLPCMLPTWCSLCLPRSPPVALVRTHLTNDYPTVRDFLPPRELT